MKYTTFQEAPTTSPLSVQNRNRENKQLAEESKQIHEESKSLYGAPKIHETLLKKGFGASLKRVQRIMKKEGIRSIVVTKFRPQSNNGTVVERTNILEQDFTTSTINQKWVADITYINTLRDG